jgi:hypothetical protein
MRQAIHTNRGVNALRNTKCANAVLQTRGCAVKKKSGREAARRFCFNFARTFTFTRCKPSPQCLLIHAVFNCALC